MGKKNKDGKKSKSGKKKDFSEVGTLDLGQAITQTARTMRTALSHGLADSGLYAGQDGVVLILAEDDGLTPGQLASRLGVKAPTMTRTIGRMEAQGFVERRSDGSDARLTKVYLTATGHESVERIGRSVAKCERLALKDFSDKEVRTLIKLLKAVDQNLHASAETADE